MGALGAVEQDTRARSEKLAVPEKQLGNWQCPPATVAYNGLKDPGAQPLFFGAAFAPASTRGPPGLPLPRVVGASP